jgi:MFS family permease
MGLIFGGFLTTYLGWRSIFWINMPIGFFALFGHVLQFRTKYREKYVEFESNYYRIESPSTCQTT